MLSSKNKGEFERKVDWRVRAALAIVLRIQKKQFTADSLKKSKESVISNKF